MMMMKRSLFLFLLACYLSVAAFGQSAVVMLKFEDAEKAFNTGDFKRTLALLDEVEQKAGVTSRTLYLRIITENKLFGKGENLYNNIIEYDRLDKLRRLSASYLKALSDQGIDDKYREVYRISEALAGLPKTTEDWKVARVAYEKAKEKERLDHEKALKEQAALLKTSEFSRLSKGFITLDQLRLHQVAGFADQPSAETATLYIIRPEEDTRKMTQMLYINDQLIEKKLKAGQYVRYNLTPGVVKIGKVHAKNKRKVSTGKAILMGGVIGLAATSGKTIAQSEHLFFLELEPGKSYFVSAKITKDKKIDFDSITEAPARALMEHMKQIEP